MRSAEPVMCPRCGTPMNHHADKPDPRDEAGEAVLEFHACPACGEIVERPNGRRGWRSERT